MQSQMRSRPFTWDDVQPLHHLVSRRRLADIPRTQTRIGDFWWTLRNTPTGDPLRHMRVWPRDDSSLTAVAWLDPPAMGDVIVAPDAEPMFDEALDRLEEEHRIAGSGDLSIVVLAGDQSRADALHQRGYRPTERGNVRFSQALASPPDPARLPVGASLHHVSTESDLERRAFVEASSFGAIGVTAEAWRSITARLPNYRPELDLIVVAPDGTGASACTVWYDAQTRCGEFEAVGTLKTHQRTGMGKAVITEGLRRLRDLGATQAIVETTIGNTAAIALYHSCAFEWVAHDYGWTKRT